MADVRAPERCRTCAGDEWVIGPDYDPESPSWRDEVPCPACQLTPDVLDDIADDRMHVRREDR